MATNNISRLTLPRANYSQAKEVEFGPRMPPHTALTKENAVAYHRYLLLLG